MTEKATRVPKRYDTLSRYLHWSMALVMLVQFTSAIAHAALPDTAIESLLWGVHKPLGVLLMALIVVRAGWALANRRRRPRSTSTSARWGHCALYVVMLLVPATALLRQYGSGRSLEVFGLVLMPGFDGAKVDWMVSAGSNFHGLLGWTLLALVAGHVTMVVHHRRKGHSDIFARMR